MRQINKDTKLFISISRNPSNFGTIIYNQIFKIKKINAIYKSFKIKNVKNLKQTILFLNLQGVSVSMPFKAKIIKILDHTDKISKKLGIVNTIKNINGKLYGFNTDFFAIRKKLSDLKDIKQYNILIYGYGAIAKTTILALNSLGAKNIYINGRNKNKLNQLRISLGLKNYNEKEFINKKNFFLINCSPLGMMGVSKDKMPFKSNLIKKSSVVMDLINFPSNTKLIKTAKKNNKTIISGNSISLYQIKYQSEIYLNKKFNSNFLHDLFKKLKISFL